MKTPLKRIYTTIKSPFQRIYTSFGKVTKAYNKVRMELWNLDVLWNSSKLDKVICYHEPLEPHGLIGWMGFYDFEDKHIHFPAVYNGLSRNFKWYDKWSAVDVLRHEFGHTLADRYPELLKKGGSFRSAFGGTYGSMPAKGTDPANWQDRCVSAYAATATQEDFAETFKFFVKHKGKIPAKFAEKPAIAKKWAAVAEICRRVAACIE